MASLVLSVQLFVAGVAAAVAVLAVRQRHAPGAWWFSVLMGGVTLWAVIEAAQQHPLFHDSLVFSLVHRLIWVPNFVIAIAVFAFALTYTGREEHVTRRRIAAMSLPPVLVVFVALCHPIVLDELAGTLGDYGGVAVALRPVAELYPIAQVVGGAYVYLLAVAASLLLLEVVAERPFPHPGQALMLLVVAPPWLLSVIHVGVLRWETFNPTIIGFVFSGIAGLVAVGRFRLFDVPLARARVVEAVDSGVVVCSGDGSVHDYNERAASLLELSNDALGTDIRTVLAASGLDIDPEAAPEMAGLTGEESTTEGAVAEAFETDHLDGRTVAVEHAGEPEYVELQVSPLRDVVGDPMSHVVLLYDVSDRERRKRDLERKNEFLDEFASVVSHDVATPLSVIENKARLVEVTGDPEHATDIYEATERVQTLVDELRDLAREGVQVGETTTVALPAVTHEAWQSVDSGDATLTVASACPLEADHSRLRQLLENLLHNSVEHGSTSSQAAPDDAVEHGSTSPPCQAQEDAVEHGSTSSQAAPDDAVEHGSDGTPVTVEVGSMPDGFYVADDGPGIPSDARDRVFEQGYTTADNGRGIGLVIVDRIVQGHGWTVEVTESEDGGARFEIRTDG